MVVVIKKKIVITGKIFASGCRSQKIWKAFWKISLGCSWKISVSKTIQPSPFTLPLYLYENRDTLHLNVHARNEGKVRSGRGEGYGGTEPRHKGTKQNSWDKYSWCTKHQITKSLTNSAEHRNLTQTNTTTVIFSKQYKLYNSKVAHFCFQFPDKCLTGPLLTALQPIIGSADWVTVPISSLLLFIFFLSIDSLIP